MFASCETLVISVFVCIIDLEYPSAHDGGDTKVGGDEVLEEHGDENGVSWGDEILEEFTEESENDFDFCVVY